LAINAWFSGRIDLNNMISVLGKMDYGINSFVPQEHVAYSYKLNDYFLAGIPVLNSIRGEVRDLVIDRELGYNYNASNPDDLLRVLVLACEDRRKEELRENVRLFVSEYLDWRESYKPLIKELITIP